MTAVGWRHVLMVVAMVAAACSGSGSSDPADGATSTTIPRARTLLRVGVEDWPACLNPVTCDSVVLREQILQHVLPVAFELGPDNELSPSPVLADLPSVETAGTTMAVTYRIDPEARWDDGAPITSSDFRGTWQAVLATPGADREGYELITEIDDRDPLVAVVRFDGRYADWKLLFGAGRGWILRADSFGPTTDLTGHFQDELPFSAGSYRLATWDDDVAVLTAVEGHPLPDRVPEVDQVRLVRLDEIDELVQPDAFDMLIPSGPDPGAAPDGFERRSVPTTSVLGIWYDRRTPLLDEPPARQILNVLVDRDALIADLTGGPGEPIACLGWLPDVGPWCDAAAVDLRPSDRELASFALFSEGWRPDPAFGTQVRDDEVFVVPLSHDPTVAGATEVAELLAEAFQQVGIGTVRNEISVESWQSTRDDTASTGVGVFPVDLGVSALVDEVYGCPDGPASSTLFWCPPEIVDPMAELSATVGTDAQAALVKRIGAFADAGVAWVPIAQLPAVSFVNLLRVRVPAAVSVTGGPLGQLHEFQAIG